MAHPSRPSAALFAALAAIVLAGCTAAPAGTPDGPDPVAPGSGELTDVLISAGDLDLLPGATAEDEAEPAVSTVDEYLERRAAGLPPIEPETCADTPVDLVLISRDAGAAGSIHVAAPIMLDGALVTQTGRQFASAEDAAAFVAAYRQAISDCPEFVVRAGEDIEVEQVVSDLPDTDLEGFVVDLDITNPQGDSRNTQYVLVSDALAVLVSSGAAESEAQRTAALDTVVGVVGDRLRAATAG